MNLLDTFRIRCKCEKCGRFQLVSITKLLVDGKCSFQTFKTPPCGGELNYYTSDQQDAILNNAAIVGYLNNSGILNSQPKLAELVDTIADDIGNWLERGATPQEMGWVDSKGRP